MFPDYLLRDLNNKLPYIPTCMDYKLLLDYAQTITGDNRNELRNKMGCKTYAEWAEFLNLA